jgi:hypothetical protein
MAAVIPAALQAESRLSEAVSLASATLKTVEAMTGMNNSSPAMGGAPVAVATILEISSRLMTMTETGLGPNTGPGFHGITATMQTLTTTRKETDQ